MNLADMLSYADIVQLSRIANTYQCECNGHSKNELIQSILSTVNRRDVFESQIKSMQLEDLRFMNSLLFDLRDTFSLEELLARAEQSRFGAEPDKADYLEPTRLPEAAAVKKPSKRTKTPKPAPPVESGPRATISRFKQYGWLFNGISGPNRYLFQVPHDLKRRFKDAMERKFASQLTYVDEEPLAYRDEQQLIGEDVKELLTFIHHNEIQLTSDGAMYKRSVLQIMDRLSIKEQLPGKGEWRFGYGRRMKDYPNRMSLIYDYCYYNGWLAEGESELTLTPAGLERQTSGAPEGTDKLYRFWLRLYKNAMPNLRSLVYWTDKLSEQWVTADSLKHALVPYIRPFYYDSSETLFEQRIVGMMLHLGLLRIGEHAQFGKVIRATPLGRAVVAGLNLEDEDAIVLD
ncbi:hypothetical protein [Paenibacillus xanthanilyticus]|uniref:Helicase XPB/Ssl2 N-terminal domain-containing protein n=1 Tax=Paenibacillus xanthanilyticus TaxID=1783531 RepID=A0ABV8KCC9_9BACL